MAATSSANRSQVTYKLEGTYPTNYGVPQGGNGTNVYMTSESFDFNTKSEQSKQIRSDRQIPDTILVSQSASGGLSYEHQYKEYDPFIEGVFQSTFDHYGTNGISSAIGTLTLASGTITASVAPTGDDAFTTLTVGQWFRLVPPAGATTAVKQYLNTRAFRVSTTVAPTSTVITLSSATPMDTSKAGTTVTNGFITSSVMQNGTTMKSYTIEVGHADIAQFRQYTGMIPSKMDVKLGVGSIVTGSFDFMGSALNLLQATSMGTPVVSQTYTPANATKGIFDIFEGGASVTATTYIKSAEFSIDNSLRGQEAVGFIGNAGIAAGTLKVSGKLEVYFADETIYEKVLDQTPTSVTIPILDPSGNGYIYVFPQVKYTSGKVNTGGLDQDNMLSVEFTAILEPDSADAQYQKTVAVYRVGV